MLTPRSIPLLEISQLDPQHGRLQRVETAIVSAKHVMVFFLLAIVAEHLYFFCDCRVVRHHCAAVAVGSKILSRIEAECRGVSQRTHSATLVARAMRLASIFNDD